MRTRYLHPFPRRGFVAGCLLVTLAGPLGAVLRVEHGLVSGDDADNDGKFDHQPWAWAPFPGKTRQTVESFRLHAPDGATSILYEFCEDPAFLSPDAQGRARNLAGVGWSGPGGPGGFYAHGFFDLLLDGRGLGQTKAKLKLLEGAETATLHFTWAVSGLTATQRKVTLTLKRLEHTPCFLATFEVHGTPAPHAAVLELLVYPGGFPWQAQIKATPEVRIFSPSMDARWTPGLTVPTEDRWLLAAETRLSAEDRRRCKALSCCVIWAAAEVATVDIGKNNRLRIRFRDGTQRAHLVFREFPGMEAAACLTFMRTTLLQEKE